MTSEAITGWLEPLRPVLAPVGGIDWRRLEALDAALDAVLIAYPVDARLSVENERSRRLRVIRRELAQHGHCGATTQVLLQLLAQFICCYRDIDLRDATGLGTVRSSPATAAHRLGNDGFLACKTGSSQGSQLRNRMVVPDRLPPVPVLYQHRTERGWSVVARPGSAG